MHAQVSLVNLTMALGIAVEFCAHPVHAFMQAPGDRPARAVSALHSAGAAVLSGIALTKLIGGPLCWSATSLSTDRGQAEALNNLSMRSSIYKGGNIIEMTAAHLIVVRLPC